jgi:two-component system CheB/CheR fusion protein
MMEDMAGQQSHAGGASGQVSGVRVLVIDDNPLDRNLVERELTHHFDPLTVHHVRSPDELREAVAKVDYDVAITDYELQWSKGTEVLRALKQAHPDRAVIMFTGSGSEEVAVEAMKEGLDDYITKTPKHYARLPISVRTLLTRQREHQQIQAAYAAREVSDARLQLAFQMAQMGTWEMDLGTGVIRYSEQIGPMFGRPRGFAHKSMAEWAQDVHPDDREDALTAFRSSVERDGPLRMEYRTLGPDGKERWVASQSVIFSSGGRRVAFGIASDITARKQSDARLQQLAMERELLLNAERVARREAEQANRAKDEFLAMLGHELRNPLAPIRNAAQILKRTSDRPRVEQTSAIIERQVEHLARLLDDLLEVSRLTRGLIELEREPVEVSSVIDAAIEQCRPLIETRRHRLHWRAAEARAVVLGDPVRLVQVVSNLLVNSAKYTPEGGDITVSLHVEGDWINLSVEDNGQGIEPDLVPHIFQLFTQARRTPDRAHGGLGLGLAVVKRLVEMHGGNVTAHSEGPDRGSAFKVCLPRLIADTEVAGERATNVLLETQTRPLRILVVDDNADAANTLAMLLQASGHNVSVEYEAPSAIERARRERPQVLLLDIGLPGMDGYELARRLRIMPAMRGAVLIAVTGYGQPEDRSRSVAAGFDHHLVKPIDPGQLDTLLARVALGTPIENLMR